MSLIECGPVRTAFQEKFQDGLRVVLDNVDAQTRNLFSQYQRHSKQVFREKAQDPEEVTEVGARQGSRSWGRQARPRTQCPLTHFLPPPQVFLKALRDPQPALRYFSSERILPLMRLRLADPSGCSYVAAMHRSVFSDKPTKGPDGAGTEAGAGELGDPELSAPRATPQ